MALDRRGRQHGSAYGPKICDGRKTHAPACAVLGQECCRAGLASFIFQRGSGGTFCDESLHLANTFKVPTLERLKHVPLRHVGHCSRMLFMAH
jgi:hypothetical protein